MSRVLVLHASSHGHTERIALAIADRLRQRGHAVELGDAVAGPRALPPPADYDAIVLGSRVQFGRHARAIGAYVRAHRAALSEVPTAFFSVSMSAASPDKGRDPNGYLRRFFDDVGWRPTRAIAFGGALPYRSYGRVLRFVMKQLSRRGGHPTDTSRDHVLTDWDAVADFADAIAGDVLAASRGAAT